MQILGDESHFPIYETILNVYKVNLIAGGATLNSIRCAQWMLGVPDATAYIGCVGKDEYAKLLEKASIDAGVKPYFRYDSKKRKSFA